MNSVAPVKEIRLKTKAEPWMNSEILELIHERDVLLQNFKKNKNEDVYRIFCKLRNKVQSKIEKVPRGRMVKMAKSEYIAEQVQENRNEPTTNRTISPLEVSNYRPISILNIASKVLERSVYNQLYTFLQSHGLLYELQSGFRSQYSTDNCFIHLLDFIRGNNEKGLFTCMNDHVRPVEGI